MRKEGGSGYWIGSGYIWWDKNNIKIMSGFLDKFVYFWYVRIRCFDFWKLYYIYVSVNFLFLNDIFVVSILLLSLKLMGYYCF